MKHTLDNEQQIFFYEQEFYPFSNFSAFSIVWSGLLFPTAEHLYHWNKFTAIHRNIADLIQNAESAHTAFQIAQAMKNSRREDWDEVKVGYMRQIIKMKYDQHEYVRRKLKESGNRILIENSWRDDFWGWGPNRDGQNMLGRLWMELRDGVDPGANFLIGQTTGASE